MPDPPRLSFNQEELTLTINGLGGGWSFGQLGELRLFDHATLNFPSSWSQFQAGVAMQVIETQWRPNARLLIEQTLDTGITFSRADGTGSSMTLDSSLKYHLLERPTTTIDLYLNIRLEGTFDGQAFEGSGQMGLGLRGTF
jgi:hypothetical protein